MKTDVCSLNLRTIKKIKCQVSDICAYKAYAVHFIITLQSRHECLKQENKVFLFHLFLNLFETHFTNNVNIICLLSCVGKDFYT